MSDFRLWPFATGVRTPAPPGGVTEPAVDSPSPSAAAAGHPAGRLLRNGAERSGGRHPAVTAWVHGCQMLIRPFACGCTYWRRFKRAVAGRLLPNTLRNSYDASGICTHALRLVTPAIGASPGVLAQRSGALAVWATGEPILVYRRAANEPSPALAAAPRQSKVRVPADGPLRDTRKGHWPIFGPLSLRLPTNSGSPVAQTTPVRPFMDFCNSPPATAVIGDSSNVPSPADPPIGARSPRHTGASLPGGLDLEHGMVGGDASQLLIGRFRPDPGEEHADLEPPLAEVGPENGRPHVFRDLGSPELLGSAADKEPSLPGCPQVPYPLRVAAGSDQIPLTVEDQQVDGRHPPLSAPATLYGEYARPVDADPHAGQQGDSPVEDVLREPVRSLVVRHELSKPHPG